MNRITVKSAALSLLVGIGATAAAWVFPMGLMLAPAFIGFAAAAWGWGAFALAAAASAAGAVTAAAGDSYVAFALIMLFLPASAITAVCLKSKKPYRTAAAASAVAISLGVYASVCLQPLLAGQDPFISFINAADVFGKQLVATAPTMGVEGDALKLLERFAAYFKLVAPDVGVMVIITLGMAFGLGDVLIARALCKSAGAELKRMAPFSRWQLTRGFSMGSLILIIGALIVNAINLKNASAVITAVECVVGLPYALMGVCLMAFGIKMRVKNRTYFIICIVSMALLFPYSIYGLCIMGAADRIFGIRKRVQ